MADCSDSGGKEAPESSPTQLELLDRAARRLEAADRTAPRRTAEWLLTEVLDRNRAEIYAHPRWTVSPEKARQFRGMVTRRAEGEPLQHILGHTSFYGLQIQVSPEVMVPRPETELVVERALACIDGTEHPRVLDVGTGSGCIALALKHECPEATVYACDVSPDALSVARTNAQRLALDVHFLEADVEIGDAPERVPGTLDLLVSNPPYIPDAEADALPAVVRDYDPKVALFAGEDPVHFYRALVDWGRMLCVPGAAVVFEAHAEYAEEVVGLLRQEGFSEVHWENDLSDRPRVVWGRIPEAVLT